MIKGMSPFQLALTAVFVLAILAGVIFFALFRGGQAAPADQVTLWGSINPQTMEQLLRASGIEADETLDVSYRYVDSNEFDTVFIETLARGQTPDLIMLPHSSLLRHRDKITSISYEAYPQRNFRDTFIRLGELFWSPSGVLALPFTVDPMIMYWNRTLFTNASITAPPSYWDEFFSLTSVFTKRDSTGRIVQSVAPLGEHSNITNATELISTLILQAGSPITERNGSSVRSALNSNMNQSTVPAQAAVRYYTEFSNPVKSFYSWNRSLPQSQDMFARGDLAVYFGFASEFDQIVAKNPNLDFDVARMPQSRGTAEIITYGEMTGLAIPRATSKAQAAYRAALRLTAPDTIAQLSAATNLPPVRKDVLADAPNNPFLSVMYDSALWSRGWLMPTEQSTEAIFRELIEGITSGRESVSGAVSKASAALQSAVSNVEL